MTCAHVSRVKEVFLHKLNRISILTYMKQKADRICDLPFQENQLLRVGRINLVDIDAKLSKGFLGFLGIKFTVAGQAGKR